jgi:hypothetical protein
MWIVVKGGMRWNHLKNATRCATKLGYLLAVQNACASVLALEEGKCVHEQIIQSGCVSDVFVRDSLVDMLLQMWIRSSLTWLTFLLELLLQNLDQQTRMRLKFVLDQKRELHIILIKPVLEIKGSRKQQCVLKSRSLIVDQMFSGG